MADIDPNFTCSDPALSSTNITPEVWMIRSEGIVHEKSILVVAIFQVVFVVLGTPWNAVVLVSIIKNRHFRDATYILLMNLVIADLLVCVLVLPFNIASGFAKQFTIGQSDYHRCQACQTLTVILISLVFVSLFTLALMAVDRVIYLRKPLHYSKYVTVGRVLAILPFMWIFSVLISTFPTFGFGEIKFANVLSSCTLIVVGRTSLTPNNNYFILLCFIGLFPFVTVVVANVWVLVIICKNIHGQSIRKQLSSGKNKTEVEREANRDNNEFTSSFHSEQIRLARVFGAIFTVNILTCAPTAIVSVVGGIVGANNVPAVIYAYTYITYISQPAIHPILETCFLGKANVISRRCVQCCKDLVKEMNYSSNPV